MPLYGWAAKSGMTGTSEGAIMKAWVYDNAATIWSWVALLGVSAIVFAATLHTSLHQFGVGLLTAAIALLVLMLVFEGIWQGVAVWLDAPGDQAKGGPPNPRRHR